MIRANVGPVVAHLRHLAGQLRGAATEAAAAAAKRFGAEALAAARTELVGHQKTGAAYRDLKMIVKANGVELVAAGYLRYHAWWSFKGAFPKELVERAKQIYREETQRRLAA